MIDERRPYPRPYFFELFTLANLAVIWAVAARQGWQVIGTLPQTLLASGVGVVGQATLGILARWGIAAARGRGRDYLRAIGNAGWLTDTARLVVFGMLMVHTYGWIKLLVPIFHARLFDQQLWDLDQHLFFGLSPTVFFLALFRPILPLFDWSYASIFVASIIIAFAYFLSAPERRVRTAFADGNSAMWIVGAWLYMLLPSLGPAYRFPEVWFEYGSAMRTSHGLQLVLMKNYQSLLRMRLGASEPINIIFGIAAFPSLHVAFQTYVFLWFRRLWLYGEIVFGIFAFFILLGSMITGWHYLIDGIGGIALAWGCYRVAARRISRQ
jgi:hypothetical protein